MAATPYPYFGGERNPSTRRWRGWVQYTAGGHITFTPDDFASKAEAVAAIKARA